MNRDYQQPARKAGTPKKQKSTARTSQKKAVTTVARQKRIAKTGEKPKSEKKIYQETLEKELDNLYIQQKLGASGVVAVAENIAMDIPQITISTPSPRLRDFWKTLWHVDVEKDHGSTTYDADIVNSLLPDGGIYETESEEDNTSPYYLGDTKVITTRGRPANRFGGRSSIESINPPAKAPKYQALGLHDMFKYLIGLEYDDFQQWEIGRENTITLNPSLLPDTQYELKVFSLTGISKKSEQSYTILDYIGNKNLCLFVDTSSHINMLLSYILNIYNPENKYNKIIYAHTREIENDPASKITYETIRLSKKKEIQKVNLLMTKLGLQQPLEGTGKLPPLDDTRKLFYYEIPPDGMPPPAGVEISITDKNPRFVSYPPYTVESSNNGLSHFYSKFPVELSYDGIKDRSKLNLNVQLSYKNTNNGKDYTITEDANKANAAEKVRDSLKATLGVAADRVAKEMVFLAKHHGDVAQTLTKFRNINIIGAVPPNSRIQTASYYSTFVSFDMNAIVKALTINTPFIFCVTNDKKRVIIFKNKNLESPANFFAEQLNNIKTQIPQLENDIITNNTKLVEINNIKRIFDEKVNQLLTIDETWEAGDKPLNENASKYREIIEIGVRIATLSNYLPIQPLVEIPVKSYDASFAEIEAAPTTELKEQLLLQIENDIHIAKNSVKIPAKYTELQVINPLTQELAKTSLEKDLLLSLEKRQTGGIINYFFNNQNTVDNVWNTINLEYNMGDKSIIDLLLCRIGTKINICWGFDLIYLIYSRLYVYNIEFANKFIKKLNSVVPNKPYPEGKPTKKQTFYYGLGLVGIQADLPPIPNIIQGGKNKKLSKTYKKKGGATITNIITQIAKPKQNRRNTQKVIRLRGVEGQDVYLDALEIEINDIKTHLLYMIDMIKLQENSDKISKNKFKLLGYEALRQFLKAMFGENYSIDRRLLLELSATSTQKGGGYTPITAMLNAAISQAVEPAAIQEDAEGEAEGVEAVAALPSAPIFDEDANFRASFSSLKEYKEVLKELKTILNRLISLRPDAARAERINNLIEQIIQINVIFLEIEGEPVDSEVIDEDDDQDEGEGDDEEDEGEGDDEEDEGEGDDEEDEGEAVSPNTEMTEGGSKKPRSHPHKTQRKSIIGILKKRRTHKKSIRKA